MQMPSDFRWDSIAYWRHYKGGRYVIDSTMGILEEDYNNPDVPKDMQRVVIYRSIDNPEMHPAPWVRRAAYFFGKAIVDGQMVPRFEAVTWKEAYEEAHTNRERT